MKKTILQLSLGAFATATVLGLAAIFATGAATDSATAAAALLTSAKLTWAASIMGTFGVFSGLVGAVYPKDGK